MTRTLGAALLVSLAYPAPAQNPPNASEILRNVSDTYKRALSYEFVMDGTSHEGGKKETVHTRIAFEAPNRYRMEGAFPGNDALEDAVVVHDGSTAWCYMPKTNEYGSFPASALTEDAAGDLGDIRPEAVDMFMMHLFRGVTEFAKAPKLVKSERMAYGAEKRDCYVVSFTPQESEEAGEQQTWWIDKKSYYVLHMEGSGQTVSYTAIQLGQSPPRDLFRFTPPPGAKKIEMH